MMKAVVLMYSIIIILDFKFPWVKPVPQTDLGFPFQAYSFPGICLKRVFL